MQSIFSVDVEDWFHILDVPSTPPLAHWDSLPSHVERNFRRLLDIFDEKGVRTTCFFLGYIAQRFPQLVREAAARNHEIASHGVSHRLIYEMTEREFSEEARISREILEDISGTAVHGYRAAGFSVTPKTPWFFDALARVGYRYDSSVFPAPRNHGGLKTQTFGPHWISSKSSPILEFPITVINVLRKQLCFYGGGYLRLYPYPIIREMSRRILEEGRPVIFYVHPREIDPGHPRLRMSWKRAFTSYVNLSTTEYKIKRILDDFEVTTFSQYIARHHSTEEHQR